MVEFDYTLNFEETDFRAHPELYRVGRGEQGVLSVEPYKSEILPHWRFKTPAIARRSSCKIYNLYLQYKADNDFVGMDMARKFLQMGWTRSLRYFNHKSGKKYVGAVPDDRKGQSGAWGRETAPLERDYEKLESAKIFKRYLDKVRKDTQYLAGKKRHQELYEPSRVTKRNKAPQPRLGLVCITSSNEVRYRALTRKRLLQLDAAEQRGVLRELYADNLARLDHALDFCIARGIRLYRMTSGLFPFADDDAGRGVLEEFREEMGRTGRRAHDLRIRLVLHPDQFVVLSSDSPQVIENSIEILNTHARVMDMLEQPRSAWALMEIHGGKANRSERLIEVISNLPEPVRARLALENDEYAYSAAEILEVCRRARVPMVFDAHHHIVREKLESYDHGSVGEMLAAARETWTVPDWQLVHISNGRESFNDRHHSDFVTTMPVAYRRAPWIEVEAKQKELAIEKLQAEWLEGAATAKAVTA